MKAKREGDYTRRFLESDFAVPVVVGVGLGGPVYAAFAFAAGKFHITSCLATVTFMFAGVLLISWLIGGAGAGFGRRMMGTDRPIDVGDAERMARDDRLAKARREGDFNEVARLWKQAYEAGTVRERANAAFAAACVYEERLDRPGDALYWFRKAQALTAADEAHYHEIRAAVERLRARTSAFQSDGTRRTEIEAAIERGDLEAADGAVAEFVAHFPNDAAGPFYLATLASRRGNHAMAAAQYQRTVELDPGHERAAFNLAVALQKIDRDLEARDAWQRYLDRFGERPSEYTKMAQGAVEDLKKRLQSTLDTALRRTPTEE